MSNKEDRAFLALVVLAFLNPTEDENERVAAMLAQEHDLVRVRDDVEVEGCQLRAGMAGTVVSVYRNGEAFAVEFPSLGVVTLRHNQFMLQSRPLR